MRITALLLVPAVLPAFALTACGSDAGDRGQPAPVPTPAASSGAEPSATPAEATGQLGTPPGTSPSGKPSASTTAGAGGARYTFPVDGKASYGKTHSGYQATDIFAACGLPVVAVTDGTVLEVNLVDTFDKANPQGADKGGLSVSLLGDDGVRYYGSHLTKVEPGIAAGVKVQRGARLGTVGKTGNASNTCHLHFGISPVCARTGDWWIRRGVLYPWSYLDAWKAGRSLSPVGEVERWRAANGCATSPPPGA